MTITTILDACVEIYHRAYVRCRLKQSDGSWGRWSFWKRPEALVSAIPDGPRSKVVSALQAWFPLVTDTGDIEWEGIAIVP